MKSHYDVLGLGLGHSIWGALLNLSLAILSFCKLSLTVVKVSIRANVAWADVEPTPPCPEPPTGVSVQLSTEAQSVEEEGRGPGEVLRPGSWRRLGASGKGDVPSFDL